MGNIGNNEKVFLQCQTYAAFTFSEDFSLGLNLPYNIAGFYAETAF